MHDGRQRAVIEACARKSMRPFRDQAHGGRVGRGRSGCLRRWPRPCCVLRYRRQGAKAWQEAPCAPSATTAGARFGVEIAGRTNIRSSRGSIVPYLAPRSEPTHRSRRHRRGAADGRPPAGRQRQAGQRGRGWATAKWARNCAGAEPEARQAIALSESLAALMAINPSGFSSRIRAHPRGHGRSRARALLRLVRAVSAFLRRATTGSTAPGM